MGDVILLSSDVADTNVTGALVTSASLITETLKIPALTSPVLSVHQYQCFQSFSDQ